MGRNDQLPDPSSPDHLRTLETMRRTGGSFAAALGEAWARADSHNHARLWREFRLDFYEPYQRAADEARARDDIAAIIQRATSHGYAVVYTAEGVGLSVLLGTAQALDDARAMARSADDYRIYERSAGGWSRWEGEP